MSEEKLYMVKTDEGEFLSFSDDGDSVWNKAVGHFETDKQKARSWAYNRGGHVVTFVGEPEKEAVSESVGKAIDSLINADTYVQAAAALNYLFASRKKKDFKRIMKAVRNGYTVKKKKYRVLAPKSWWHDDVPTYLSFSPYCGMCLTEAKDNTSTVFTKEQLSAFGLDGEDFQKEEVTDDEQ